MDRPLVACVLAGGTGTRLYPASTGETPKQFRSFGGEKSLLARTVERLGFVDAVYVSTRAAFAERVRETLADGDIPVENLTVLTEPEAKDTGPALVYAAHRIGREIGESVILALPSDHHVAAGDGEDENDVGGFEDTMETAARVAVDTGGLVTVGIEPTRAATGYGYLKPGDGTDNSEGEGSDEYAIVESFREKPDPGAAARYLHHGYLWNAGMFAWTPTALLDTARRFDLAPLVDALDAGNPHEGFETIESVSIDHAVLETAAEENRVYVVRAAFEWDDLGAWDAFERVTESDDAGNTVLGEALVRDASGTIVASDADTCVSVLGVSDLVVAAYDDRVLVIPKREAQRVREIVAELRERGSY